MFYDFLPEIMVAFNKGNVKRESYLSVYLLCRNYVIQLVKYNFVTGDEIVEFSVAGMLNNNKKDQLPHV